METALFSSILSEQYFLIFEYVLFAILYLISRDELHKWLAALVSTSLIFYFLVGKYLQPRFADYVVVGIYFFALVLFFTKVGIPRIKAKGFSYRPVALLLFFIFCYFVGLKITVFDMPWITGYISAIIFFIIGFFIVGNKMKGKQENSEIKDV